MRLELGDIIRTNYGTGPYRITEIYRGCRCDEDHQEDEDNPCPPHIHLTVEKVNPRDGLDSRPCYLNRYDEETLRSLESEDCLIVMPSDAPVQTTLKL